MDQLIATNTVPLGQHDVAPTVGAPGLATDGNPATGVPATTWPAYAWNMLSEEQRAVIVAAGIAPSSADWTQLLQAIRRLSVQMGTGIGQLSNLIKVGWSGSDLLCTVDTTDEGAFAFKSWVVANFTPRGQPHHFTTSNSWTCPAGVFVVQFDVVGAGGAGGAGSVDWSGAGGGGGGRVTGIAAVTPGQSYALVAGASGQPIAAGGTGGAGGSSQFDAFATATGGLGGGSSPQAAGGAGGLGVIGANVSAIASAGGYGTDGQGSAAATGGTTIFGGNGGSGARGDGGGRAGAGAGLSPVGPSGGGGGGYYGAAPGAHGGVGEIVLWY